jgi:hypothetical protein
LRKRGWFSGPPAPASTLASPVTSRSTSIRLVSRCSGAGSTCFAGAVGLAEAQDWRGAGGRRSPGSTSGGSSLAEWTKHCRRWFVARPVARAVPLPSARLPLCDRCLLNRAGATSPAGRPSWSEQRGAARPLTWALGKDCPSVSHRSPTRWQGSGQGPRRAFSAGANSRASPPVHSLPQGPWRGSSSRRNGPFLSGALARRTPVERSGFFRAQVRPARRRWRSASGH